MRWQPGELGWWLLTGLYVAVVFAAQPYLGFAVDALKARWGEEGFATAVTLLAVAVAVAVALAALPLVRAATRTERLALAVGASLYIVGVATLEIPQERLHYAEYGLLAGLVFAGLQGKRPKLAWPAAVLAIVIVAALGWLDETLQGAFWERRYFDWRDVQLNVRAAALGTLIAVPLWSAYQRVRRR
jgi:hypothetical protein